MKTEKGVLYNLEIQSGYIGVQEQINRFWKIKVETATQTYIISTLNSLIVSDYVNWFSKHKFLPYDKNKVFIYNKWHEI